MLNINNIHNGLTYLKIYSAVSPFGSRKARQFVND